MSNYLAEYMHQTVHHTCAKALVVLQREAKEYDADDLAYHATLREKEVHKIFSAAIKGMAHTPTRKEVQFLFHLYTFRTPQIYLTLLPRAEREELAKWIEKMDAGGTYIPAMQNAEKHGSLLDLAHDTGLSLMELFSIALGIDEVDAQPLSDHGRMLSILALAEGFTAEVGDGAADCDANAAFSMLERIRQHFQVMPECIFTKEAEDILGETPGVIKNIVIAYMYAMSPVATEEELLDIAAGKTRLCASAPSLTREKLAIRASSLVGDRITFSGVLSLFP